MRPEMEEGGTPRWTQWAEWLCFVQGPATELQTALGGRYAQVKQQLQTEGNKAENLKTLDPVMFNPLAKTVNNPWTSVHKDAELLEEINKDVTRTFQELPDFRTRETQTILANVLFTWCKKEKLGYKQGLNDIAGVFVYACMQEEMSAEGIEPVTFSLFQGLLSFQTVRQMFYNSSEGQNFTLDRCEAVFDRLLKIHDAELHRHLATAVEVAPALFLLRWLRLLFVREFPIDTVLHIWDALFRDVHDRHDAEFAMADYFALAMMRAVRGDLLRSDNSNCLRRLLKFPNVRDHAARLISSAMEMRDGDTNTSNMGKSNLQHQQPFLVADEENKKTPTPPRQPVTVNTQVAAMQYSSSQSFSDPLASVTASVTAITQSLMPMAAPVLSSMTSFLPGHQFWDDSTKNVVTTTLTEVIANLEASSAKHEVARETAKLKELLALMKK